MVKNTANFHPPLRFKGPIGNGKKEVESVCKSLYSSCFIVFVPRVFYHSVESHAINAQDFPPSADEQMYHNKRAVDALFIISQTSWNGTYNVVVCSTLHPLYCMLTVYTISFSFIFQVINAREGSPLFYEQMDGNNRTVDAHLNTCNILLNQATWILLLDFFIGASAVCGMLVNCI